MVLPWHSMTISALPQSAEITQYLRERIADPGVYDFPAMPMEDSPEAVQTWETSFRNGPIGMLFFQPQGSEPMPASMFSIGFLLNVATSLLTAFVLSMVVEVFPRYGQRVCFISAIAVTAALVSYGPLWNWMYYPLMYCMVMGADLALTLILPGLAIAYLIRPAHVAA